MKTYIAILRGINVGGKKKIRMADLQTQLSEAGLKNIRTYIQSGNVIFKHAASHAPVIAQEIETVILKHYGFQVPVLVLTVDELAVILSNNPFLNDKHADSNLLHVTFLSEQPQQNSADNVAKKDDQPNECSIGGRAVYLFCPNGYSKTTFTNTFFEKTLNVTATTRNWKTANTLLDIANDL